MRSTVISILTYGIILLYVSSCATVPTEPLNLGELKLISIHIAERENLKVNLPFVVNIKFEADGKPVIRTACFYWSDDGPYCHKVMDVNYGSPGTIKVQLRAKTSGSYVLESYVLYIREGKPQPTNVIGYRIRVVP